MADPGIPTEALEAAAHDIQQVREGDCREPYAMCQPCEPCAVAYVAAAAPHLIAEGRRQAAADIRSIDVAMVENLDGDTTRVGLTVAANIAERGHG